MEAATGVAPSAVEDFGKLKFSSAPSVDVKAKRLIVNCFQVYCVIAATALLSLQLLPLVQNFG